METTDLQNKIIKRVQETDNEDVLIYIYSILTKEKQGIYKMSEIEKSLIEESIKDYKKGNISSNEDVFKNIEKWLNE